MNGDKMMDCRRREKGRLLFFDLLEEQMKRIPEEQWEEAKQSSAPDCAWELFGDATRAALRQAFGHVDEAQG